MDFFKKNIIQIYRATLFLVLIVLFSRHFTDFNEKFIDILWTIMFCLIGIFHLTMAWAFDKPALKLTFLSCGVYVIIMNFLPDFEIKLIIGIICIVTPFIILKILPKEDEPEHAE